MKSNADKKSVDEFPFDLDALLDVLADRVAERVIARIPATPQTDGPLLLTVEQAGEKLGRSKPAMHHLIRELKLPTVRFDRRVMLDMRDIIALVNNSKN